MSGVLSGKTAIITGGAGGVGAEASRLFAREGACVYVLDPSHEGVALQRELRSDGHCVRHFSVDASNAEDIQDAVDDVIGASGKVDILFNHAGVLLVKRLIDMSEDEWDRIFSVNVKSMFLTCRAVLPYMVEKGEGVILNTSSVSAVRASALESAYCASKAAILQLTRTIAIEYRSDGIRCNAICPGFIRTEHGLRELEEFAASGLPVSDSDIVNQQGRLARPEEVAGVALNLVSDASSFVNGAALYVDNGASVRL